MAFKSLKVNKTTSSFFYHCWNQQILLFPQECLLIFHDYLYSQYNRKICMLLSIPLPYVQSFRMKQLIKSYMN